MSRIEIRCPEGPNKLLSKLKLSGEPFIINDDNLMELACSFCSDTFRKQGQPGLRVIHRFNFLGELVDTMAEPK